LTLSFSGLTLSSKAALCWPGPSLFTQSPTSPRCHLLLTVHWCSASLHMPSRQAPLLGDFCCQTHYPGLRPGEQVSVLWKCSTVLLLPLLPFPHGPHSGGSRRNEEPGSTPGPALEVEIRPRVRLPKAPQANVTSPQCVSEPVLGHEVMRSESGPQFCHQMAAGSSVNHFLCITFGMGTSLSSQSCSGNDFTCSIWHMVGQPANPQQMWLLWTQPCSLSPHLTVAQRVEPLA
jgi:hypothetical protein